MPPPQEPHNSDSPRDTPPPLNSQKVGYTLLAAMKANGIFLIHFLFFGALLVHFQFPGGGWVCGSLALGLFPLFLAPSLTHYGLFRLKSSPPEEKIGFYTPFGKENLLRFLWVHSFFLQIPTAILSLWLIHLLLLFHFNFPIPFLSSFGSGIQIWFFPVSFLISEVFWLFRANFILVKWVHPVRAVFTRTRLFRISLLHLAWSFCLIFYLMPLPTQTPSPLILFLFGLMHLIATAALHPAPSEWSLFKGKTRNHLKMVRWLEEGEWSPLLENRLGRPGLGFFDGPHLFIPIIPFQASVHPVREGFLLEKKPAPGEELNLTLLLEDPILGITLIGNYPKPHPRIPPQWVCTFHEETDPETFLKKIETHLTEPKISGNPKEWILNLRTKFLLFYSERIHEMVKNIAENQLPKGRGSA